MELQQLIFLTVIYRDGVDIVWGIDVNPVSGILHGGIVKGRYLHGCNAGRSNIRGVQINWTLACRYGAIIETWVERGPDDRRSPIRVVPVCLAAFIERFIPGCSIQTVCGD